MGFTQTDTAEQNNIGVFLYKVQAEEVLHLGSIDLGGPGLVFYLLNPLRDRIFVRCLLNVGCLLSENLVET